MGRQEEPLLGPGSPFTEKYRIECVLGEGGMGVVYRALHVRLSQRVAIKTLRPEMLERPQLVARFEREARAAAQLRSRHAVRVLDVGELPSGLPFMVMEYLEGRDLADELESRGPLPVTEAVDLLVEACSAMAEAHERGIVHRDIKPSNLFLAEEGGGVRSLKVLDFGISKFEGGDAVALTSTQAAVGTPLYMSPEQVRSARDVDRRTDVWSLGVVLYELLTGQPPFGGGELGAASVGASIVTDVPRLVSSVRADVPKGLSEVIAGALAKKREDRFADAGALSAALLPYSSHPESAPSHRLIPTDRSMASAAESAHRDATIDASSPGARTPLLQTEAAWVAGSPGTRSRRRAARAGIAALVGAGVIAAAVVGVRSRPSPSEPSSGSAPSTPSTISTPAVQASSGAAETIAPLPAPSLSASPLASSNGSNAHAPAPSSAASSNKPTHRSPAISPSASTPATTPSARSTTNANPIRL